MPSTASRSALVTAGVNSDKDMSYCFGPSSRKPDPWLMRSLSFGQRSITVTVKFVLGISRLQVTDKPRIIVAFFTIVLAEANAVRKLALLILQDTRSPIDVKNVHRSRERKERPSFANSRFTVEEPYVWRSPCTSWVR